MVKQRHSCKRKQSFLALFITTLVCVASIPLRAASTQLKTEFNFDVPGNYPLTTSDERYYNPWFTIESWIPSDYDLSASKLLSLPAIFNGQYNHVNFGVKTGGTNPFSKNENTHFMPASNMKLVTAHAALKKLGPDFRFQTLISYNQLDDTTAQNFQILGDGDPTWGMSEFGENLNTRVDWIANQLWQQGIRKIQGDIELIDNDNRYKGSPFPEGWGTEDIGECYGAMAYAFNMNINCAFFQVTGLNSGRWVEEGVGYPVQFKLRAGSINSMRAVLNQSVPGYFSHYTIEGTYKVGSRPEFLLAIYNPNRWVRNLLINSLQKRGIEVSLPEGSAANSEITKKWDFQKSPESDAIHKVHFAFESAPLGEIIKPMLKMSLNHTADALYRALATRLASQELSLSQGGDQVISQTWEEAGIPLGRDSNEPSAPVTGFVDGSGLSRKNLLKPSQLFRLLEVIQEDTNLFVPIWNGLPIAGQDGTLKNRMIGTSAQGVLRGKTGTLTGVYALSGYVPQNATTFIPFVMIANTTAQNRADAINAMDRAGVSLSSEGSAN